MFVSTNPNACIITQSYIQNVAFVHNQPVILFPNFYTPFSVNNADRYTYIALVARHVAIYLFIGI